MLGPQRYSERLGLIEPDQLQEAARRLGLGEIRDAYPAGGGPFGQNIVLETASGRMVLRGAPYGHVQLTKERRVARHIQEGSSLAVPWPYEVCEDTDIFGWAFAIVPFLGGEPGADLWAVAGADRREDIAGASGEALARLHEAEAEFFGPYDGQLDDFIEMDDFPDWFLHRLEHWRRACRSVNGLSTEAERYIDSLLEECAEALEEPFNPVLVHHDFVVANLNFDAGLKATGVFDLGEAALSDGEQDLVRMLRTLDTDAEREAFVDAYTSAIPLGPGAGERLALYALADWLVEWERLRRLGVTEEEASFVESTRPVVETARHFAG